MNLVLLFPEDFVAEGLVRLEGRRRDHVLAVHRAGVGEELAVGLCGGKIGRGAITRADPAFVEMRVRLEHDPPVDPRVTLILALPRPKVLNRVVAAAASLGVKRVFLVNAWRVEKSYWKSPRLAPENLRMQAVLGLEQAKDTVLPVIELRRLFRPFVDDELPNLARGTTALVAHPYARDECPRAAGPGLTLAVGPEGGFIDREIDSLEAAGLRPVHLGSRVLRVETAVAWLLGRVR